MKKAIIWLVLTALLCSIVYLPAFAERQFVEIPYNNYSTLSKKDLCQVITAMTKSEVDTFYNSLSPSELDTIIEKIDTDDNYFCVETVAVSDSQLFQSLNSLPIEKLIRSSTVQKSNSAKITGTCTTKKYKTDVLGFKVQLTFSWEATSNASGFYELTSITKTTAKYYCNYILLYLTWNAYYYQHKSITRSFNKKKANFTIRYSFSGTRRGETTLTELNMFTNISYTLKELLNG